MSKFLRFSSKLTLSFFALFVLFSCSKDADLLSEYVINDNDDLQSLTILTNDSFYMAAGQNTILMDVLNNDNLSANVNVTIIETSAPLNGIVTINDDNTLTYRAGETTPEETTPEETTTEETTTEETTPEETTPEETTPEETTPEETTTEETTPEETTSEDANRQEEESATEDTFTYTAEVVDEETGAVTVEEATVTVTPVQSTDDTNSSEILSMGELLAFPGASGYGKNTTGGRGGIVYNVTNLNDEGAGSLRYGVETISVPRTIVFDISGYINLESPLKIREGHGNLTIAGQTAPGDGITLRGASLWIHEGNVIIKYLKVKPGNDAYNPSNSSSSSSNYEPDDGIKIIAYSGNSIENIILDHCTVTWAADGLIDVGSPNSDFDTYAKNITISNCLLAENIDKQYGVLIQRAYDISFYRNIIAFTDSRNIAIASAEGKGLEMVNNLIYGTRKAAWYTQGNVIDFIGNKYISGPFEREYQTFRMEQSALGYDINNTSIYINDNTDNLNDADKSYNDSASNYIVNIANHNTNLEILSQSEIENSLINNVGNNLHYDQSDIRIMNSILNRNGDIISNESNVGGYPNLKNESRPNNYDSDKDGMSDSWEISMFGNLSKNASNDANSDGYTNLETFLYSLEK